MEFCLLGAVEVREGDRRLEIPRGKPRVLLAVLLVEAGRVVSVDGLLEALWGERPPPTAGKALQLYVGRLRRVLGPERIATEAPGYAVRAAPEELDVWRFEDLAARGRDRMARGDPAAAARLLDEALALWRGPALADLAYETALQTEALRLEELRLGAREDRAAADLALGRHSALTAELEVLVAAHPLRERLREQLMLALYRSGRQSEALAVYRDAREQLVEGLGLEPGPALQALELAILEHDPALGGVAAPAVSPSELSPALPERKLVTVLVVELSLPEDDPERLRVRLDLARSLAAEEIVAAGGRVERASAGTIVAAFGAPTAQEDHVSRALDAALALRRRLRKAAIDISAGVETGLVLAEADAVAGAAVAAARRLAGAASDGDIIVGSRAAAAARDDFVLREGRLLGRVARRGEGVRVRAVVGRERELSLLGASWEHVVESGRPHLVTLVGDPGVGKTSVVGAATGPQRALGRWYAGRCLAYGRGITYRPLGEIVRARLHLDGTEDEAVVRERLGDRAALGLVLGLEPDAGLHPWEQRERLRRGWIELLDELAGEGPAVVVVEDLHWAEEELLDLLEQTVRSVAGPILVLATTRPELLGRRAAWGTERADASRIQLEPLLRRDASALLDRLVSGIPGPVRESVLDRAEGNPFFVEEIVASLLDRGALRRTDTGWSFSRIEHALGASDSVQSVIAARIDLLPGPEKQLLQAAAVVGRVFWEEAARTLADAPDASLDLLSERDFVHRRARSSLPGAREFAFKHALTREVAHESLALAPRARLHAAFAEWLEGATGGDDEHAPLLAHHYASATTPEDADLVWAGEPARAGLLRAQAVQWLRRAAELAADRYELGDALALLDTARDREEDTGRLAELWHATAAVHRLGFDVDAFRAATERALALAPHGPVAASAYGELAYAGAQPYIWREPPPSDTVDAWIGETIERAEPGDADHVLALVGRANLEADVESADTAVALAERLGDAKLRARAYEAQLLLAMGAGHIVDAGRWAQRLTDIAGVVGDPHQRSGALFLAIIGELKCGHIQAARGLLDWHDAVAEPLSPHHAIHAVAARLLTETVTGQWEAAGVTARRALGAADANTDTPCQFNWRALGMGALGYAMIGERSAAQRLKAVARERATMNGPPAREPALLRLALVRENRAETEALLAEGPGAALHDVDYRAARLDALAWLADSATVEIEAEEALALGGYEMPFARRALGITRGRRDLLTQAAAAFAAMGLDWRAAETRAVSGR